MCITDAKGYTACKSQQCRISCQCVSEPELYRIFPRCGHHIMKGCKCLVMYYDITLQTKTDPIKSLGMIKRVICLRQITVSSVIILSHINTTEIYKSKIYSSIVTLQFSTFLWKTTMQYSDIMVIRIFIFTNGGISRYRKYI